MKRWLRIAAHLYPAAWRRRYGVEFDAMLEDAGTGWNDVFDILKGALTMQLTFWNLKTIIATFGLIGVLIAAAAAFGIQSEYASKSVMRLTGDADLSNATQQVLSRSSLEKTIVGLDLYQARRRNAPLEDIVQHMRLHDIIITRSPASDKNATIFAVAVHYPDPNLAQAVDRQLVSDFIAALPRAGALTSLEVLDPPSRPRQPFYPHKTAFVLIGLAAGLLAGLTVAYALRWRIAIVRRAAH